MSLTFRKVLENGNPIPPIKDGHRGLSFFDDVAGSTGLFSAALYALDTVPVYDAIASALNGDMNRAGVYAKIAIAGAALAYVSAAVANLARNAGRANRQDARD